MESKTRVKKPKCNKGTRGKKDCMKMVCPVGTLPTKSGCEFKEKLYFSKSQRNEFGECVQVRSPNSFKSPKSKSPKSKSPESKSESETESPESKSESKSESKYTSDQFIATIPKIVQNMFNEKIVFKFYSKSVDAKPGHGTGETILPEEEPKYKPLIKTNFRKKLSNFWIAPFVLNGKRWNSVEHYYQGSKFRKENPEIYKLFSLDSGSNICEDPNMAKSAGGKDGIVKDKDKKIIYKRPKTVTVDKDFFSTNRVNEEMYKAQYAKFTQNEDLWKTLQDTLDAKLMHIVSRSSTPVFFENLVVIRHLKDLIKSDFESKTR